VDGRAFEFREGSGVALREASANRLLEDALVLDERIVARNTTGARSWGDARATLEQRRRGTGASSW
jgi:hypothetical protein